MKGQERKCPYCQGTGNDPKDARRACPVCKGRKTVKGNFER